jgi:hypothetical protein
MYNIPLAEEELGKVSAILPSDACNESYLV